MLHCPFFTTLLGSDDNRKLGQPVPVSWLLTPAGGSTTVVSCILVATVQSAHWARDALTLGYNKVTWHEKNRNPRFS